jgi:hypothetical protein
MQGNLFEAETRVFGYILKVSPVKCIGWEEARAGLK